MNILLYCLWPLVPLPVIFYPSNIPRLLHLSMALVRPDCIPEWLWDDMSAPSRTEVVARSAAGPQQSATPRETLRAHDPNTDGPHGCPYPPRNPNANIDPQLQMNDT